MGFAAFLRNGGSLRSLDLGVPSDSRRGAVSRRVFTAPSARRVDTGADRLFVFGVGFDRGAVFRRLSLFLRSRAKTVLDGDFRTHGPRDFAERLESAGSGDRAFERGHFLFSRLDRERTFFGAPSKSSFFGALHARFLEALGTRLFADGAGGARHGFGSSFGVAACSDLGFADPLGTNDQFSLGLGQKSFTRSALETLIGPGSHPFDLGPLTRRSCRPFGGISVYSFFSHSFERGAHE